MNRTNNNPGYTALFWDSRICEKKEGVMVGGPFEGPTHTSEVIVKRSSPI